MALITYQHTVGKELSPEALAAKHARIAEANRHPYTPDPDSPLMTDEQLTEFRNIPCDMMEPVYAAGATSNIQNQKRINRNF